MKLYGYFRSSASYRIRIALNLKGLEAGMVPVNLIYNEHRSPEFLQMNPQGLVPALQTDEGAVLSQSLAIMEYLDERYPENPLLPQNLEERARVRALAQAIACEMAPLGNLRVLKYLTDSFAFSEDKKQQWIRHWVATGFEAVEALLANSPYTGKFCHGDTPGMGDACLVPQVFNAKRFECDLTPYSTIRRIVAACEEVPAFDKAHPTRQPDAQS